MTLQSIGFQHYTTPPTFRVELAERPVLLDLLRADGNRRLVLLDAPAGYGKTWLLTRWYAELRKAGNRVVWLGADPMDPAEFLALMVAGFQRSGIDVGRLDGLAAQGFADVPLRAVLTALTATLEATPQPVVIFLDDLHRLGRDAVQDVLTRLVHEAPPAVRFVFSGRDLSTLPRADLRTRGELLEIGAEQLRFGRDESRSPLPLLSKEQLDRILERTEGWPVALQLARLWLQAKPERSSLLDAFSGRTTEVAEYLTEQVLADLEPVLQKVLSEVAILDALNPALVAEVTGSPDETRDRRELRARFWRGLSDYLVSEHPDLPDFEVRQSSAIRLPSGLRHIGFEMRFGLRHRCVGIDVWFWRAASMPIWEGIRKVPAPFNDLIGGSWEFERLEGQERAFMSLNQKAEVRDETGWPALYQWLDEKLSLVYERVAPKLREEMERLGKT